MIDHGVVKRSAARPTSAPKCQHIRTQCLDKTSCGTLPMYNFLTKSKVPDYGPGVAPWKVQFYIEGVHACDGSLVEKRWILTHKNCGHKIGAPHPSNYTVARLGAYKHKTRVPYLSAYDEVIGFVNLIADKLSTVAIDTFRFEELSMS